ncbi:hypothetical protein KR044_009002, partial [Drosophila immigrans]
SSLNLKSIIRAVVKKDWEGIPLVLQMANEACTLEMSHAIFNTVWQEWQQDKQIYDPIKILDFFEHLEHQSNAPNDLLQTVYQAFVSRSAQLLSAPFHADSICAEFPKVNALLLHLRERPLNYMRDILETMFDDVLSSESALSVAQRLFVFHASLSQLTMANLQMLNRTEVEFNSKAHTTLLGNLRKLMYYPNFKLEGDPSLVAKVFKLLLSEIGSLFIYKKVCLRKANNVNDYLYEGSNDLYMWTRKQNYQKASFIVQSVLSEANNETEFAFQSPYWEKRYLTMDWTIQAHQRMRKNLFSKRNIDWWHVKQVLDGVAIYDAATSSRVICGGDPAQGEGKEHYAYTHRVEDFDEYRQECTWIIEDCSNK